MQHDLAALQVSLSQLALILHQLRVIRGLGLQGGQLVFGGREFAAGQVLLQLCDGSGTRLLDLIDGRWRALAGAQQQGKCGQEHIT